MHSEACNESGSGLQEQKRNAQHQSRRGPLAAYAPVTAGVGDVLGPDVVGVVTAVPEPETEPLADTGGELVDLTEEVAWRNGNLGLRPPPVLRLELLRPMSLQADCRC